MILKNFRKHNRMIGTIVLMLVWVFLIETTVAQDPVDLDREILVYIQPAALDFPVSERGTVLVDRIGIRSQKLSEAFSRFSISGLRKAFPDFIEADTLKTLEDGRTISLPRFSRIFRLTVPDVTLVDTAVAMLKNIPGVLFAEKNTDTRPQSDDDYSLQWHLNNTGQSGGTAGEDIRAEAAWSIFTGSSNVRIGIIDSGVDLDHDDLDGKSSGDSYTTGANFPVERQNHGTHVAGIAAALHGNAGKVRGVDANALIESRRIFEAVQYMSLVTLLVMWVTHLQQIRLNRLLMLVLTFSIIAMVVLSTARSSEWPLPMRTK